MAEKPITLSDIAGQVGVSTVTVSKALRGHPDISPSMIKKIKSIADQLGYTPNLLARNLSARKSNTIGVIVPQIAHAFFSSIIDTMYDIAFEKGYELILMVSHESAEREKSNIQTLLSMRVDGIIISITEETKNFDVFDQVYKRDVPIVFIDKIPKYEKINSVTVDDFNGALKATEHAINIGYRRIGHFTGSEDVIIARERLRGFSHAMNKHKIKIHPDWIVKCGFDEEAGYWAFIELHKNNNLPDFIFTVTYPVAFGIYAAAKELGLSIPNDIDLLSFGNARVHSILTPALSCIDQPTDVMAKKAMDILLNKIHDPEDNEYKQVQVDTNLIIRETCVKTEKKNRKK